MLQMGANPALGLAPLRETYTEWFSIICAKSLIKISLRLISKAELNQIFSALILFTDGVYPSVLA